jgi:hypothetical protein
MEEIMRAGTPLRTLMAGAISLAILGGMMVLHAMPLWTGDTMVLPVTPSDPRDYFQGEYVRLNTPSTRLAVGSAGDDPAVVVVQPAGQWWQALGGDAVARSRALRGRVVYVQFERRGENHEAVTIGDRPVPGALNLRGKVTWFDIERSRLDVDYGLSRYYVQEGTARPIEEALDRRQRVQMEIAVTPSGRSRIRRVLVDGGS